MKIRLVYALIIAQRKRKNKRKNKKYAPPSDHDGSPERFGPFGVREDFRGRKLGRILLDDCLLEMKKRGLHNAWMQWTSKGGAAHYVYEKAGFYLSRGHVVMDKIFG